MKWNRTDLKNTSHPKYLGVMLDRTLSYKHHIHYTKMKVATRNNLLRKFSSSKWGTNASTIRETALALSYSVAEYAAPVWARSAHAYKLDSELNSTCRAITGCLKPTNVEELYLLSGIAPPSIRRDICARVEKAKQEINEAHSLHGKIPAERRLVPTTPACTWWNRPEEDNSSGKLESTHPSRTSVKSDQGFFGVESVMHVNADSLLIRAAATSTSGTLND